MYESYFGFSESPFENNLDHRFLFISEDHKEVLSALFYFVKTKKGFAIVCGDVGTGKTMLINSFLSNLPKYVQPIIVANPCVSSLELLRYIAKTLQIEVKEKDGILDLTDDVKELLKEAKSLNKQFVLIIDEAHLLSDQALEEIRLLSNIETQDQKLLQILLVGQYELSYKLDRPEMRHLRQRININRFLSPMDSSETRQYIDHRLRQVGSSFSTIFADNCGSAIYKMTRGVPRNINQLCDNALLICMSEMRQKVDRRILRKAQEALITDRLFTPKVAKRTNGLRHKLPRGLVWTAGFATALALGAILSQAFFQGKFGQQLFREASHLTGSVPDQKAAPANQSGSVNNKIPGPRDRGSSYKVAPLGGETFQDSAMASAVPQTGSPESPEPANLAPSSMQEARESSAMTPKALASTGEGPKGGPFPEKPASPGLSSLAGQPPMVEEPVGPPAQIERSNTSSDDILKLASRPRTVKKGETLNIIASQAYKGSEGLGIEAIILDNPEIRNQNLIHPGQVVFLPWINPHEQIMQLRDHLFYAYYGRYDSADTMKRVASLLEQKGVKYTTITKDDQRGPTSNRILLGGYKTGADLQKALDLVKANQQ